MNSALSAALKYLDQGWPIIPLNKNDKTPLVRWKPYQDQLPTEADLLNWWKQWPDAIPATITGRLSGVYVVDCDTEEALTAAKELGLDATPVRVKTKRGWHFYFAPPDDEKIRGPRVGQIGSSDPNFHWPKVKGLDWRGDGAYVGVPYEGSTYQWQLSGHDLNDIPPWSDIPAATTAPAPATGLHDIDLSSVRVRNERSLKSEWDRAEEDAAPYGGRLPTGGGNARNERVMRVVSDAILEGLWGVELLEQANKFMDRFFQDRLDQKYVLATVRSMMAAEKRNHPERFDPDGKPKKKNAPVDVGNMNVTEEPPTPPTQKRRAVNLIYPSDAARLVKEASQRGNLISPLMPSGGSIIQVFGYSGHGKSTFVQHLLAAASYCQGVWGPFEIARPVRTLYLDFENGKRTIGERLMEITRLYGGSNDLIATWAPFVEPDGWAMHLGSEEGLRHFSALIRHHKPDVVVIDTLRSAWAGFEENDASAWTPINQLALKLRNHGITVVKLHHSTKPTGTGKERTLGRSSGSSNQLTNLETQLGVVQIFDTEEKARSYSGLFAGDLEPSSYGIDVAGNVWDIMKAHAGPDYVIDMMIELRYAKLRERTAEHDDAYLVAFVTNVLTGHRKVVGTLNVKQRAQTYARQGLTPQEVAVRLNRRVSDVTRWLGPGQP